MSSETVINVDGISKRFEIYENPRDRLRQMLWRGRRQFFREFWALRDVSFDVKRGETIGIIGQNGSGKSTLLQIIAGTLNPTGGNITTNGRVAALLELGSGFNPEYTGRENIFMYGSILGMSREQMQEKYQKIIEFSEIADFIDQPLKTYSSGMYVRLAFSVAIHVDPEVLIVDEALSVGDAFFQAKCMTLMRRLMDDGVTLLFVSHDTSAVKTLCNRAVLLDHGNMIAVGNTEKIVEKYYSTFVAKRQKINASSGSHANPQPDDSSGSDLGEAAEAFKRRAAFHRLSNGKAEFVNVEIIDEQGYSILAVDFGQTITLRMHLQINEDCPILALGFHIKDKNGADIVYDDTGIEDSHLLDLRAGERKIIDWTFRANLREGDYTVSAVVAIPLNLSIGLVETCDHVPMATQFRLHLSGHLPVHGAVLLDTEVGVRDAE